MMWRRLIYPLSILYGLGASVDRIQKRARSYTSSLPVLSVGNLSVGGTGKTPLVVYLVRKLQEDYPVLVLSRGYGRETDAAVVWENGEPIPEPGVIGDEPSLIARFVRRGVVAVSSSRVNLLRKIERKHPRSVVILDDGFQHHRLTRDLDIVIIDHRTAQYPWLLPSGYLREAPSALQRAGIILATSSRAEEFAAKWKQGRTPVFRMRYTAESITHWALHTPAPTGGNAILVTGIAQPERALRALESMELIPRRHLIFEDHYLYNADDARRILDDCATFGAEYIVTTAKDAVKLQRFPELTDMLYVIDLETTITGEEEFMAIVRSAIEKKLSANI